MGLQRHAGPREAAHDRADRNLRHLGRLPVAEPFHGHQQQRRALVRRQAIDRAAHFAQGQPRLDPAHGFVRAQAVFGGLGVFLADGARANLVDPDRLHDAEHPAVEPGALLKLVAARQRALARRLRQIVGLDRRAC